MKEKIKAGTSFRIASTIYLDDKITPANLTGALITTFLKKTLQDTDASALIKKDNAALTGVTVISAAGGTCETLIAAAETNKFRHDKVFVEVLVKMADGNYIRSETDEIEFERNLINSLT